MKPVLNTRRPPVGWISPFTGVPSRASAGAASVSPAGDQVVGQQQDYQQEDELQAHDP
jgi:hypothetical protein